MKALSVRPEQRYQYVDSFKADLLNGMSGAVIVAEDAQDDSKKETKKAVKSTPKKPKSEKILNSSSALKLFILIIKHYISIAILLNKHYIF